MYFVEMCIMLLSCLNVRVIINLICVFNLPDGPNSQFVANCVNCQKSLEAYSSSVNFRHTFVAYLEGERTPLLLCEIENNLQDMLY